MRKTDLDRNRKKNTGKTREIFNFSFLFFLVFVSIIILCSLTFITSGCAIKDVKIDDVQEAIKGKAEIAEMVICKNVDSDHAPVDPTSAFDAGTNSIFLSVKFTNFKITDKLKVTWTYIDTNRELSVQEFSPPEFSSGYYSFNIAIADAFPGGKYAAQVELNNDIIKTIEFSIKGN
jgi:hypothetical protein